MGIPSAASASPRSRVAPTPRCARGEEARVSGRSPTPWTHELVDGSICSYLRGSCRSSRHRARGPNERARNAGGGLGVCGAARRGQGRGGEGAAKVKSGRGAAHACGFGRACGRGRCTRARAGVGGARAPSASISATLPRRAVEEREEEVGPRVRGQSGGSDPADRCTWVGDGAQKAIAPRLRAWRARATAGRPLWAKALPRHSREHRGQLFCTCAQALVRDLGAARRPARSHRAFSATHQHELDA